MQRLTTFYYLELSALATGTLLGISSSVSGLINATVTVFKESPKVAIETVRAVGRIGSFGGRHPPPNSDADDASNSNQAILAIEPQPTLGIDPALLAAEQIEKQLVSLNDLLGEDLPVLVQDGGMEVLACSKRLEALKNSIGQFQSKHTLSASGILDEAITITTSILNVNNPNPSKKISSSDWQERIDHWQKSIKALLSQATRLRSFAAAQPGQGFGGSLETTRVPGPNDSEYTQVMRHRQQKLLIMRSAMRDAQDNLARTTEAQLAAQDQIIELARTMKDLQHQQATLEWTKGILRKSIDVMVAMQDQIRTLAGFFNALANIISIVGKGQAERYLDTINKGITKDGGRFAIAYNESQIQVLRETVITLRAHFSFVVKSADMYQEIATSHINPCIRMAASLPLSATPEQQEAAKAKLKQATDESSEAIKLLAQQELGVYYRDLEQRCQKIEEELGPLALRALEDENENENLKAIEQGVKESGEEVAESIKQSGALFDEIMDDI